MNTCFKKDSRFKKRIEMAQKLHKIMQAYSFFLFREKISKGFSNFTDKK